MEISSRPDELFAQLYPDVMQHGSLLDILNYLAQEGGFSLRCDESIFQGRSAVVRGKHGKSQIYLGAKERVFSFDFWQKGVQLAKGFTDSPQKMMLALHELLEKGTSPLALGQDFSFVKPDEKAASYYGGAALQVQEQWDRLQQWTQDEKEEDFIKRLASIVNLARQHPQLGQLFPFIGMGMLYFSRCTGYPFEVPCSRIGPIPDRDKCSAQRFVVASGTYGPQCERFEGTATEVLEFVAAQLPPACGPARQGTAENN
ncbi:MAG: hypothetical protein KY445_15465 [Armatimonadetes bacterium]|nr:hypothetical protein [Armatimonadota bacterium]